MTLACFVSLNIPTWSDQRDCVPWIPKSKFTEILSIFTDNREYNFTSLIKTVSVLWREEGYTVKYCLRAQATFHRLFQIKSQYRHSRLHFQYFPSWESNIGRVDSPYWSSRWGYIFQYTPISTGSLLENIPLALLRVYFPVHSQ